MKSEWVQTAKHRQIEAFRMRIHNNGIDAFADRIEIDQINRRLRIINRIYLSIFIARKHSLCFIIVNVISRYNAIHWSDRKHIIFRMVTPQQRLSSWLRLCSLRSVHTIPMWVSAITEPAQTPIQQEQRSKAYRTAFCRLPERRTIWSPQDADVFDIAVDAVMSQLDGNGSFQLPTSSVQYK